MQGKQVNSRIRCGKKISGLSVLVAIVVACGTQDGGLAVGRGSFVFYDSLVNVDLPINVRYYMPQDFTATTPIVFVMHGASRDGPRYTDDWVPEAERYGFLLLVPEFSSELYDGAVMYNLGNMFSEAGDPVPQSLWTYTAVEHLFDHVKQVTGSRQDRFRIYGHSAGGQFVHRFLMFRPNAPVERAVAANAGWYTMPLDSLEFPYGLRNSGISEQDVRSAFSKPTVILLGDQDIDSTQSSLRRTPEANAQGPHRFARGHSFWLTVNEVAARIDASLAWGIDTVPGAHHSDALMAPKAASILAGSRR
jgi:poly(3-hydroxybutyrate) depolymerase